MCNTNDNGAWPGQPHWYDTLAEELLWPTDEMKRLVAQMDSLDANADDVILDSE